MNYELYFIKSAKKEWDKLAVSIKIQFKKKLEQRLINPIVPKDRLSGLENCFKIKLRTLGYRLVYEVINEKMIVKVIAVGKRDKDLVYKNALYRKD